MRRKSLWRLWWLNHFGKRDCGLEHASGDYVVAVYYGGYWCEQRILGPFDYATGEKVWNREFSKGHGALLYRLTNVTELPLNERRRREHADT